MDVREILGRRPRAFDDPRSRDAVRGKTVLVTGAGGSIGAELCAALGRLPIEGLILFEQSEGNLVDLERRLDAEVPVTSVLGDVTDHEGLRLVMAETQPDIVYHAAALKHVVLLERNPVEAARVNILGTRCVVGACADAGVSALILLSTDKAVAPTSLMGATKHLGERIVRAAVPATNLRAVVVRLVNVAGSRGSVVPRFEQQAGDGRPVTLSSLEATRWFISNHEAVSLLMTAAWCGDDGDTLVPELGAPRRVVDVARAVLRAAGRSEDAFVVGTLGPGEKVHETLLAPEESGLPSQAEGVLRISAPTPRTRLDLRELEAALRRRDAAAVVSFVLDNVPGYQPSAVLERFCATPQESP